ncbi:MAG TPA: tetratricopeptide repeat protein [Casimicrobiaceae bacterium]|nr:tetratricopeptide repeat protein [Casimicrobiaceae bacterium]
MTAINLTRANFDEAVLQGSGLRPVLVDFWAPWCGPCRTLAPILDRIAAEYDGRLTLAKLNTEDEPELAGEYGVRGIPNCKLFIDGGVVDEFTGALPEGAIRDFLAVALPSPAAPLVAAAKALLAEGDPVAALARLDEARAQDEQDEDLLLTRIEALLAASRPADANALISGIEGTRRAVRDLRRLAQVKARAAFARDAGTDLATLARRTAAAPADCAAMLAYANALASEGDYERALEQLLAIVRTDRKFGDDIGRKTMLTVFAALPGDSAIVRRYRRELAGVLN